VKAISYLRYSTQEQALGDSERRQLNAARDYCARNGLELDENGLADRGRSGYKGDNLKKGADLANFLADVESGKIPGGIALIVENLDRLSRQGIDKTIELLKRLTSNGIDVHVISLNRVLKAGFNNNLTDYVIIGVQADLAIQESAKKADRVLSVRKGEREQAAVDKLAFTARCPSWIKAEAGHKPVIIADRAATVRRIFQMAAEGIGAKRIVRALIAEDRQPFASEKGGQGKHWTPEFVLRILHNRATIGHFQPHRLLNGERTPEGDEIRDFYPAVVDQSLFDSAQQKVNAKNHNPGKPGGNRGGGIPSVNSILSPLVHDATYGRIMVFWQKKGDAPYLMTKWESKAKSHYIRYDRLEEAFMSFLEDLNWEEVSRAGETAELTAATGQHESVLGEIDRISKKIAYLQTLIKESDTPSLSLYRDLDDLESKLVDASSRQEKFAAEVASERSKLAAIYSPDELREAIKGGKNPDLRLKLKNEIARRISRIDISFTEKGKPDQAIITLINGYQDVILFE
jgi:DNA invertase Pin-like site-specific DNA recombinase